MPRPRGLTTPYFPTAIALAHANIQRSGILLSAQTAKKRALRCETNLSNKKALVRARDRHRKSGYFRAGSYRQGDGLLLRPAGAAAANMRR